MTSTEYIKNISGDFLNGKIDLDSLTVEINSSSIIVSLSHISTTGDVCSIWFKDALSTQDQTTLDSIVSNHAGIRDISNDFELVKIQEESTPTGGNFASRTFSIPAAANSVGIFKIWWPFPISALTMKYSPDATQINDKLDVIIGEDTICGAMTTSIASVPSVWTSQNYVVGDKVKYTHPVFGERVYTCFNNTVSNENPTNKNYWQHGFKLDVSPTVIQNVMLGYRMSITDGVNVSDLGYIVKINSNHIFTEKAPTTTFSASSPTYVRLTVEILKDFNIGYETSNTIGEGKIGGSYLPADTVITGKYTNNHSSAQTLQGTIEYLY